MVNFGPFIDVRWGFVYKINFWFEIFFHQPLVRISFHQGLQKKLLLYINILWSYSKQRNAFTQNITDPFSFNNVSISMRFLSLLSVWCGFFTLLLFYYHLYLKKNCCKVKQRLLSNHDMAQNFYYEYFTFFFSRWNLMMMIEKCAYFIIIMREVTVCGTGSISQVEFLRIFTVGDLLQSC